MKLTIIDDKTELRENHIKSIIEYFDQSFPIEQNIFNWNSFFSEFTMFKLSSIWAELGIEYSAFYKRNFHDYFNEDFNWIQSNGPYNKRQLEVLICIQNSFNQITDKSKYLKLVLSEIIKQGDFESATLELPNISNDSDKGALLVLISIELFKLDNLNEAKIFLSDALAIINDIDDEYQKIDNLLLISEELLKNGWTNEGLEILRIVLHQTAFLNNEGRKALRLKNIAALNHSYVDLTECEFILKAAVDSAEKINDFRYKAWAYWHISNEYYYIGNIEKASILIKEAFGYAKKMNNGSERFELLAKIITLIFDLKIDVNHIKLLEGILSLQSELGRSFESNNVKSLWELYLNLNKQDKHVESRMVKERVYEIINNSKSKIESVDNLINIILISFSEQNPKEGHDLIEKVIFIAEGITDNKKENAIDLILTRLSDKIDIEDCYAHLIDSFNYTMRSTFRVDRLQILNDLVSEFINKKDLSKAIICMSELISYSKIKHKTWAFYIKDILSKICIELLLLDKLDVALEYIHQIDNEENLTYKTEIIISTLLELTRLNKIQNKLQLIDGFINLIRESKQTFGKLESYRLIAGFHSQIGNEEIAKSLLYESLDIVLANVKKQELKDRLIRDIAGQFVKSGLVSDFLHCLKQIDSIYQQCEILMVPLNEDYPIDTVVKDKLFKQVLSKVGSIGNERDEIFVQIGIYYVKQVNFLAASGIKDKILNTQKKIEFLLYLSSALLDLGLIKDSESALNDALKNQESLNTKLPQNSIFDDWGSDVNVFNTLLKQNKLAEARIYLNKNTDSLSKSKSMVQLSKAYYRASDIELVQDFVGSIPEEFFRKECWNGIAKQVCYDIGIIQAFEQLKKLNSAESRLYYLYGVIDSVDFRNINYSLCVNILRNNQINEIAQDRMINLYYLNLLFFDEIQSQKIDQLKKVINIQWAIDIKNSIYVN